jgi:hypothetical protein
LSCDVHVGFVRFQKKNTVGGIHLKLCKALIKQDFRDGTEYMFLIRAQRKTDSVVINLRIKYTKLSKTIETFLMY